MCGRNVNRTCFINSTPGNVHHVLESDSVERCSGDLF